MSYVANRMPNDIRRCGMTRPRCPTGDLERGRDRRRTSSNRADRSIEVISRPAFRPYEPRLGRIRFYLAAKPHDLRVDLAVVHLRGVHVRQLEKLIARQDPLWRRQQCAQQEEFAAGKLDVTVISHLDPTTMQVQVPPF